MANTPHEDGGERLTQRLTFMVTPATEAKILKTSKARRVPYAFSLRDAVQFWIDNGCPVPAAPTEEDDEK